MSYDFGFDFRATQAFVTDPSYATYVLPATTYPTTRAVNGVSITFGWESGSPQARDRSTGVNAVLAGMNFITPNNATTMTFRVDLPAAGVWSIGLASGDAAGNNSQKNYIVFKDASAQVLDSSVNTASNQFGDASKALWSAAAWPGSNVSVNATFATTILRMVMGGTVDTQSSCIATLRIINTSSSVSQLATLGAG